MEQFKVGDLVEFHCQECSLPQADAKHAKLVHVTTAMEGKQGKVVACYDNGNTRVQPTEGGKEVIYETSKWRLVQEELKVGDEVEVWDFHDIESRVVKKWKGVRATLLNLNKNNIWMVRASDGSEQGFFPRRLRKVHSAPPSRESLPVLLSDDERVFPAPYNE